MIAPRIRTILGLTFVLSLIGSSASFASSINLGFGTTWTILENGFVHGQASDNPMSEGEFFKNGPLGTDVAAAADLASGDDWFWTSSLSVSFQITDWAVASDRYAIWHSDGVGPYTLFDSVTNGTDWNNIGGACSVAGSAACHFTLDVDTAFSDSDFAQGIFTFAPGEHHIKIQSIHIPLQTSLLSPQNTSTVAFRADEIGSTVFGVDPIPEPSTLVLLGTGLIVGAAKLRRQKKNRAS